MKPLNPSPLSHAARRNRETCAEPGPCGRIATMDVVLGGVPIGFCDEDAHPEAEPMTDLPGSTRLVYYNPLVDPARSVEFHPLVHNADEHGKYEALMLHPPTPEHPANVVSSLCVDGLHRPALDIDVPCWLDAAGRPHFLAGCPETTVTRPMLDRGGWGLIPSSTPGHHHLYHDEWAMPWEEYRLLLEELAGWGILEPGYVGSATARQQTVLRMPHVRKVAL